jgi:hypothetical protein
VVVLKAFYARMMHFVYLHCVKMVNAHAQVTAIARPQSQDAITEFAHVPWILNGMRLLGRVFKNLAMNFAMRTLRHAQEMPKDASRLLLNA